MTSTKSSNFIDDPTKHKSKIPSGWTLAELGDLVEINPKGFHSVVTDETEISFIPMTCVEEETGRVDTSITRPYREVKKGYTPFINGDIIFAKITPCMENGKIAILRDLKNGIGCGSTEFHVLRVKKNVCKEFIFYHLMDKNFRKKAQTHMRGSAGQQRVPSDFLHRTTILLPTLSEQQKIASIISKVDDLVQETEKIVTRTQRLKKGLMQKLLTGNIRVKI